MSRHHRERGHGRPHRGDAGRAATSQRHAPSAPLAQPPAPNTTGGPEEAPIAREQPAAAATAPLEPAADVEAGDRGSEPPVGAVSPGSLTLGAGAGGPAGEPQPGSLTALSAALIGRPAGGSCTPAQLRRFIKSRAWIPMHELRRRFAINGAEDEMTLVEIDGVTLFIGLPDREGRILGDLLRGGEVGFELSHDPSTPVIVGVYPMRPVPRP
ncbi:MAG: hypothetical protein E6I94_04550 [Chloroflexi bacterium]|nr:MAG: hypothetical protein E6I94_04550 [Chloroflexota bacterium]